MIVHGDSLKELARFPDNYFSSIVTDPPYGLAFMGKKWDYNVPEVELWKEVFRVLKPGGHLLSFGGTRTYHRMVVNIEDAGFEIRDQIQWIYGSGFPKSHNIGNGFGTALKPANEPICVARKPLEKGLTVAENVLKYGTGAINIDECRVGTGGHHGGRTGAGNSSSFDLGKDYVRQPHQIYTQGRWPANVIFDEEAAEMLDAQSGNLKGGGQNYSSNSESMFGTNKNFSPSKWAGDSGGASRFFYCAKASKSERNRGLEGLEVHRYGAGIGQGKNPEAPTKDKNFHPTVKPLKLMEYLIKLVTPPTGIVLDPFCGSGSTGVAAKNLEFGFVGIEMNEEYVEIAKKRTEAK